MTSKWLAFLVKVSLKRAMVDNKHFIRKMSYMVNLLHFYLLDFYIFL